MAGRKECEEGAAPEEEGGEEEFQWRLDNIPIEVFLHIFSFLDANFVIHTLSLVCRKFYEIVNDTATWKIRISKQWPGTYPPLPVDDNFDWKRACMEREDQWQRWVNGGKNMDAYVLSGIHYSSVDVVHFVKGGQLCLSGSRDRSIVAWSLADLSPDECTTDSSSRVKQKIMDAHKGWVWSFASCGDNLASGSWDTTVKIWQIAEDSIRPLRQEKCRVAVLCVGYQHDILAAGLYDKKVLMYDPRADFKALRWYTVHRSPVLCMEMDGPRIITGSEDGTVVVWDRRMNKLFKSLKIPDGSYPMSMYYKQNHLYVGDKTGHLHLINGTNQKFEFIKSYTLNSWGRVTGVHYSMGSIITCATDGTVRVLEPSLHPKPITVLSPVKDELAGIDVCNGVVAAAASNGSVLLWKPRL